MNERKINERGNISVKKTHDQQSISEKMSQGTRGGGMFRPRDFLVRKKGDSKKTHLLLHTPCLSSTRFYSFP